MAFLQCEICMSFFTLVSSIARQLTVYTGRTGIYENCTLKTCTVLTLATAPHDQCQLSRHYAAKISYWNGTAIFFFADLFIFLNRFHLLRFGFIKFTSTYFLLGSTRASVNSASLFGVDSNFSCSRGSLIRIYTIFFITLFSTSLDLALVKQNCSDKKLPGQTWYLCCLSSTVIIVYLASTISFFLFFDLFNGPWLHTDPLIDGPIHLLYFCR